MPDFDFTQDSKEVLGDISEIFSNETESEIIQTKINELRSYLTILLQNLEIASQRGSSQQKTMMRKNLTPMMKNAYQIIMQFRTAMLGKAEEVTYRIYIRGEDETQVSVVDISESDLLKVVERSENTLRLKRDLEKIDKVFQNNSIQQIFEKHFKNVWRSFKHIKGNNFVVPIKNIPDIYSQAEGASNLYWQTDNGRGKSAYTPKMFNRGWIYQAFDSTANNLYENISSEDVNKVSLPTFRYAYFTKHLVYDNVVGFKGGDVGLNQIKTNMANLMSITTLKTYIKDILSILTPNQYNNPKALSDFIKEKFLEENTDKKQNQVINSVLNKNIDTLLSVLT